jgi:hypothetical protein
LWETSLFVGPGGVVLAIVGVIWSRRRAIGWRRSWCCSRYSSALGSYTPLFKLLYPVISGLTASADRHDSLLWRCR